MNKNKVNKETKKSNSEPKIKRDSTFWGSVFILIIMVFSIAGFALMGGSGGANSGELPDEIPFQQFENEGVIFWGAIKNSEQFIFQSIEGFDNDTQMINLGNEIKTKSIINIYVDNNYQNSDAVYLIDKSLRALKIGNQRVLEKKCTEDTLVITTNETLVEGNCMKFITTSDNAYRKAEILTYQLVK